jgi:Tfp pilus assembly protein PilO
MMSNRVWIIATVLLSTAVAALGWFLGISPKLAEAGTSAAQLVLVQTLNGQQEAELAALKEQYEDIDEVRAELAELHDVVPPYARYADFYRSINALSASSGVSVMAITPGEPAPFGAAPAEPAAEGAPAPATAPVETPAVGEEVAAASGPYSVPMNISVSGSYEATTAFIGGLQGDGRLYVVTNLDFARADGEYTVLITGYIFVLVDQAYAEAVTPAEAPEAQSPEEQTPTIEGATPAETPAPTETPAP